MKITDEISLKPLQVNYASKIYDTIDAQREYLGKWLPFVADTTSVEVTQSFVDSAVNSNDKTYTILKGKRFVGLIGFKATDIANRKTEISYWLSEDHQGQGIMTLSVDRLCKYAFEELEMNRVQIKCAIGNIPSRNIPLRLGFKLEGIERAGELFPDGNFADLEVYSCLKDEYDAKHS